MTQLFEIHPTHPQQRLINQAVAILEAGGVIAYPTDATYALACHVGDKNALQRIRQIRQLDDNHHLTLICRDLKDIANYAIIDNTAFRFIKAHTPGPYTFILNATREVPKRLLHPKRKSIGIRVPDNAIAQALLAGLNEPLLTSTLILPSSDLPLTEAHDIAEKLAKQIDLVIDGGNGSLEMTTVIRFDKEQVIIERQGLGPLHYV